MVQNYLLYEFRFEPGRYFDDRRFGADVLIDFYGASTFNYMSQISAFDQYLTASVENFMTMELGYTGTNPGGYQSSNEYGSSTLDDDEDEEYGNSGTSGYDEATLLAEFPVVVHNSLLSVDNNPSNQYNQTWVWNQLVPEVQQEMITQFGFVPPV